MVFKLRQVFTQTTPLEIAQALKAWTLEGESPASAELVNFLTPAPYAFVVALTGYDPYEEKKVPRGPLTFINQLGITGDDTQSPPLVDRIRSIFFTSDEEREERNADALYPRERWHQGVRVGLGSLAPTPYNPKVGQERAMDSASSLDRKEFELRTKAKEVGMPAPSSEVLEELRWRTELYKGWRSLSPMERAERSADIYDRRYGVDEMKAYLSRLKNEYQAKRFYEGINPRIYPQLTLYERGLERKGEQLATDG